jgi:hypothetical protein
MSRPTDEEQLLRAKELANAAIEAAEEQASTELGPDPLADAS